MSVASSVPSEISDDDESDYTNSFSSINDEGSTSSANNLKDHFAQQETRSQNITADDNDVEDNYSYDDDDFEQVEERKSAAESPTHTKLNPRIGKEEEIEEAEEEEYTDGEFEALDDQANDAQGPIPRTILLSHSVQPTADHSDDPVQFAVVQRLAELENKNVTLGSELRIRQQELNSIAAINWKVLSRKKERALQRRQAHERHLHQIENSVLKLTTQLETSQSKVLQVETEISEQHIANQEVLEKYAREKGTSSRLESELDVAHERISSLEKEIQCIRNESENRVGEIQKECEQSVSNMRDVMQSERVELEIKRGKMLEDCMHNAKNESKRLASLKESLDKQLEECATERARAAEHKRQAEARWANTEQHSRAEGDRLRSEVRKDSDALQKELALAQQERHRLTLNEREITSQLHEKISATVAAKNSLQHEKQKLELARLSLETERSKLLREGQLLGEARAQLHTATKDAHERVALMRSERNEAVDKVREINEHFNQISAQEREIILQRALLDRQACELAHERDGFKKEQAALRLRNDEQKSEQESLVIALSRVRDMQAELQNSVGDYTSTLSRMMIAEQLPGESSGLTTSEQPPFAPNYIIKEPRVGTGPNALLYHTQAVAEALAVLGSLSPDVKQQAVLLRESAHGRDQECEIDQILERAFVPVRWL